MAFALYFHNFTKRFAETNVKIAQLSRLVSAADAKKTKEKLQNYEERLKKTEKILKKSKYKEEDNDEFEDEDYLNKKNKYK